MHPQKDGQIEATVQATAEKPRRKALKEKFDSIVKDFTQYEKLEKHAQARRQEISTQKNAPEEIER